MSAEPDYKVLWNGLIERLEYVVKEATELVENGEPHL